MHVKPSHRFAHILAFARDTARDTTSQKLLFVGSGSNSEVRQRYDMHYECTNFLHSNGFLVCSRKKAEPNFLNSQFINLLPRAAVNVHIRARQKTHNTPHQVLCGVCNAYSAHIYTRLAALYPRSGGNEEQGMAMTKEFCLSFFKACKVDLGLPATYCTEHVLPGSKQEYWSYPPEISCES